jgi:hypothetical protein
MNKWTPKDRRAIEMLSRCTFLPRSYDKRFVRSLAAMEQTNTPMSDKQLVHLWRMVYRYRRQITETSFVELAQIGLGLVALVEWMRGPQELPKRVVRWSRVRQEARHKAELEKLARWEAG